MRPEESWGPEAASLGYSNETDMLRSLYKDQGFSLSQIAAKLRKTSFLVRRRLILRGVPLRGRGGRNHTKSLLVELSNERLKLESPYDLAEELKVHPSTVFAEKKRRRERLGEKWNSALSPPLESSTDSA